jgi:hypothetical protein
VKIEEIILRNPIRDSLGFDRMRCDFLAQVKEVSIKIPAEIRLQIATGVITCAIIHHTIDSFHHLLRNVGANDRVPAI